MPNSQNIKKTLEKISFPRLSGTENEQRAAEYIKKQIYNLNLTPEIHKFIFTSFYPRIYKRIVFSLIFWLILVFYIDLNFIFTISNIFIVIFIFVPLVLLTRKPEKIRLGKKHQSENIYVKIESMKPIDLKHVQDNNLQVFFLCHIDSKSQRFSIKIRVISVKLWIYSLLLIMVFLVIKYLFLYDNFIFNIVIFIEISFNFVGTILIMVNTTHNESNGAIDNASGICLVLDLLNYYIKPRNRLKNIDLWFVFTGCEETGTMGIRHFFKIISDYNKKEIKYFNLDSVAKELDIFGPLKKKVKQDKFLSTFFKFSKELNPSFHLKRYILAVNRSDGYYLKREDLVGLGFGDKSSYKYIHSQNDTVDKVNPGFLADVNRVIIKFLKEYDNNPN